MSATTATDSKITSPSIAAIPAPKPKGKITTILPPPPPTLDSLPTFAACHNVTKTPSPLADRPQKHQPSPLSKEPLPTAQPPIAAPQTIISVTKNDPQEELNFDFISEEFNNLEKQEKKLQQYEKALKTAKTLANDILDLVKSSPQAKAAVMRLQNEISKGLQLESELTAFTSQSTNSEPSATPISAKVESNPLTTQASPTPLQLQTHQQDCELHYQRLSRLEDQCKKLKEKTQKLRAEFLLQKNIHKVFPQLTGASDRSDLLPEDMKKSLEESRTKFTEGKNTPLENEIKTFENALSDSYHLLLGRAETMHASLTTLLTQGQAWIKETDIVESENLVREKSKELTPKEAEQLAFQEKIRMQMARENELIPQEAKENQNEFYTIRTRCKTQHQNIRNCWNAITKYLAAPDNEGADFDLNIAWTACISGVAAADYKTSLGYNPFTYMAGGPKKNATPDKHVESWKLPPLTKA